MTDSTPDRDDELRALREENARLRERVAAFETGHPARFEDLLNAIEGIVWEANPQTLEFMFVSKEAERLLGYPVDEWYTAGFWRRMVHPDDREWAESFCMAATARGDSHEFEYRAIAADGRVVWLRDLVTVGADADRRPTAIRGVMVDVSEQRRVEEAYLTSQFFLEKAQEIAHIGHWVSEAMVPGGALVWSDETCRIFGVSRDEFDGRIDTFLDRVHPDDKKAVAAESRAAIEGARQYSIEHRIVRPDGTERWVNQVADVIRDLDGRPIRMVGVVQDVTERTQLEDQLRQSQKMEAVGRLAGGIAHDFNNLLTIINGYASLVMNQLYEDDPFLTPLDEIRRAGDRASDLTRQLLAFSRRQILQPKVIDLDKTVVTMGKMVERLIGEDVELEIRTGSGPARIKVDPGQVEQIIANLAVNARDAMPSGGRLTIETRNVETAAGRFVRLDIADTGTGMDPETLALVFEPFFTTKELGKGTGLGLSTVYGIVDQSGGKIEVKSEVGRGTVFEISFPRVDDEPVAAAEKAAADLPRRGTETVLVVEDRADVRRLTVKALEMHGYTVIEAAAGDDALKLCEAYDGVIHLLLSDVVMPRLGGLQLADLVKAHRPHIKVLLMSGYTETSIVTRDPSDVETAFIAKPFTPLTLARKVREVLDE